MTDEEKKILADMNAKAEAGADYILSQAVKLPHTWVVLLILCLVCATLGGWIRSSVGC